MPNRSGLKFKAACAHYEGMRLECILVSKQQQQRQTTIMQVNKEWEAKAGKEK